MKRIKEITLYEVRNKDGTSWDKIHVESDGSLNLDSFDCGTRPEMFFGGDYERDIYIDAEWKDSFLLLLLKERFENIMSLRKWADEKGIPSTVVVR